MTSDQSKFEDLIWAIEIKIRQELRLRCEAYTPDFKMPEVFNVLTPLLARQATLAIELASAPQLWNGHSAPLFLRAMTDVHITLSWILLDPKARARQYIEHGLGQAVLEVQHRKKKLESAEGDAKEDIMQAIRAYESWINTQMWSFLVEVNVGAWSGRTTREMAEESGILDFYNYVYTPFSQCTHSTWYHVGRYNSGPFGKPAYQTTMDAANRRVTERCLEFKPTRQVPGQVIQGLRRKSVGACALVSCPGLDQ
jgi:hypothetical protein